MEGGTIRGQIARLVAKYSKDKRCLDSKDYDNDFLTGKRLGLDAGKLVYLYYDIIKKFSIEIYDADIANYQFATITGITELVEKRLEQTSIIC